MHQTLNGNAFEKKISLKREQEKNRKMLNGYCKMEELKETTRRGKCDTIEISVFIFKGIQMTAKRPTLS